MNSYLFELKPVLVENYKISVSAVSLDSEEGQLVSRSSIHALHLLDDKVFSTLRD